MKVENSVVLITGANRGIGKSYAEEFLKSGAAKIYLAVRDTDSVSDFIAQAPEKLIPLQLDVTNAEHIKNAAQTAKDVTILINNAGILHWNNTHSDDVTEQARQEMEVNYIGPLAMIKAFAPVLKANGGGAIATVSSIAGHLSFPNLPTYSASKAAAHSLIMATRLELAEQNTHVVGVYPGPIETDMTVGMKMDMSSPNIVAQETIAALENGTQDVFPDETAKEFHKSVRDDPKAVEAQMLEYYKESKAA